MSCAVFPSYNVVVELTAATSDITTMLVLSLSSLPKSSQYPLSLATSPIFLNAMSRYLGNTEPSVRLLGMFVAEEVAKMSSRSLKLGEWDGQKDGREWVRRLRTLMQGNDRDATFIFDEVHESKIDQSGTRTFAETAPSREAHEHIPSGIPKPTTTPSREPDSDDDSLIGYGSSPNSSRAPSPTPSELAEIEADPSLRTGGGVELNKGAKKILRPVYLVTLGELMRPSSEEGQEEFKKIEMALKWGEDLIRRKKDYGTELGEQILLPSL